MSPDRVLNPGIIDPLVIVLTFLSAGIYLVRYPRNRQALGIVTAAWFTIVFFFTAYVESLALCRICHIRYDLYIYQVDSLFGQPSFVLGRVIRNHPCLWGISAVVYALPCSAFLFLTVMYCVTQSESSVREMMRTIVICLFLAPLEYLILPVSGPFFAFRTFPVLAPVITSPHVIMLEAVPNGVPSIHMAYALLFWYFARRWRIGILVGGFFALFTVLATLGLGQHYLFDLLVAVPHTALSIYLGANGAAMRPAQQTLANSGPEVAPIIEEP